MGLGPAQGENRVPRARAHRRQPVGGGAPEQVEEDGLGLIVGRVAGGGAVRAEPRAELTRARASRLGPAPTLTR